MIDFMTLTTMRPVASDLTKHVNYTQGMVLGVDDFTQEFAYLAGRDQWLARDLLGYGTVSGLQVTTGPGDGDIQVKVTPGVALSPRGELICVSATQCAFLNAWLRENQGRLPPGDQLPLYVVLCYRDCATDRVPIPGEPCRSEDSLTAPSRLKDDFQLELRLSPPQQREEDALRDFVVWLRQVPAVNQPAGPGSAATPEEFAAVIRQAADLVGSPPGSPLDYMLLSPPSYTFGAPPASLRIPAARYAEYMRLAFQIWATELRPLWRDARASCALPDEGCLLLAQLDVALTTFSSGDRQVAGTSVPVIEARRPFFAHLRLLQEWLLSAPAPGTGGGGGDGPVPVPGGMPSAIDFGQPGAAGTAPEYAHADHVHAMAGLPAIPAPPNTDPSANIFGQASERGASSEYARADHEHAMPPAPAIPQPGAAIPGGITFGGGGAVGTAPEYAHADHSHPMQTLPAIPQPGGVPTPIQFPQVGAAGNSLEYARANHVHQTAAISAGNQFIIAAGQFNVDGSPVFAHNGLQAIGLHPKFPRVYLLTFDAFDPANGYVVKGTPWTILDRELTHTCEYVGDSNEQQVQDLLKEIAESGENDRLKARLETVDPSKAGLLMRVRRTEGVVPDDAAQIDRGFMVEISQFKL